MTDDVTATLQAKTEGLSVSVPRPETVRLSAEHHRRVRRVSAGGVAVVSVAALLVALASGVGGQSSTSPAPADTPTTPSHNPSAEADTVPALAAHPLLSEQDWRAITYGPGTRSAAVKGSAMLNGPALTICTPDPRTRLVLTTATASLWTRCPPRAGLLPSVSPGVLARRSTST
jgi:hypothetical protein